MDNTARFASYVNVRGPLMKKRLGRCHVWTGGKDKDGYGVFAAFVPDRVGTKSVRAHRFALARHLGRPLAPKMGALHRCNNTSCVRVSHLFEGTAKQNARQMVREHRNFAVTMPEHYLATRARGERNGARLHPERVPRGERHGYAKLTTALVLEIRAARVAGETFKAIAARFGIAFSHVHRIVTRQSWAHV